MSFSDYYNKHILPQTNAMMDNVAHLHDNPFTTVKNPKVRK
jgi:hypothetical protein